MELTKEQYHQFCSENDNCTIFMQDWWLDATAGPDNWDAAVIDKGGRVIAVWPYYVQNKKFFKILLTPKLTPHLGIWIEYPDNQKYATRLSYEKQIINELIQRLPRFDRLKQTFHYKFSNWLPLYWNGFKQTTGYTYIIEGNRESGQVFQDIQQNIRRQINKAQKHLIVEESDDLTQFYKINMKTFDYQKMKVPYAFDFINNIDSVCKLNNCRKILIAKDDLGNIHAAHYYVWDSKNVYYLMGGSDPDFRMSGATSLLMWEGIKMALDGGRNFDFEGSSIESIERFFRGFGARQQLLFILEKINSPFLKFKHAFK